MPRTSGAKKDPNKPKCATTAYAYFLQYRRDEEKKAGKPIDFTAFSQQTAAQWRGLEKDDKETYFERAAEDKKRFQDEMTSYVPPDVDDDDEPKSKRGGRKVTRGGKKKERVGPKRALSGFMFFSSEKRPVFKQQDQSASIGELAKKIGAAWQVMTTEQKTPFEDLAKKDRKRYEEEKEAFAKGLLNKETVVNDDEESEED